MFADTTVEKKDSGVGVGEGSAVLGSISGGSAVMVSATLKFRKKNKHFAFMVSRDKQSTGTT